VFGACIVQKQGGTRTKGESSSSSANHLNGDFGEFDIGEVGAIGDTEAIELECGKCVEG